MSDKACKLQQLKKQLIEIGKEFAAMGTPGRDPVLAQAVKYTQKGEDGNWESGNSMWPWIFNMLAEQATNFHNEFHPEEYRDDVTPYQYMGVAVKHHIKGKKELIQHAFDERTKQLPTGWYSRICPRAPMPFCTDINGGHVPFMDWLGPFETEDQAYQAAKNWQPKDGELRAKHEAARAARYAAHEYLWGPFATAVPQHKLSKDEQMKMGLNRAGLTPPIVINIGDED
jgi:hypothetical protein